MNFPKFSESKGILKIGRSEVCVSGGSSSVGLLNQEYVYVDSHLSIIRNMSWKSKLTLLSGYKVTIIMKLLKASSELASYKQIIQKL